MSDDHQNFLQYQLLQLLLDSISSPVFYKDISGICQGSNKAFEEFIGLSRDKIVGQPVYGVVPEDSRDTYCRMDDALLAQPGTHTYEVRLRSRDGALHDVMFRKTTHVDEGGKIRGVITTIVDVSEQKKSQEDLHSSETRFRELFSDMHNAVAVYEAKNNGEDFIFKDINRAAERIDKIRRDDVAGKSVLQIFPGVKEFGLFDIFKQVWETGQSVHQPISLYHDDRLVGWRENYVYKLPSGEIVAVYEDITERKNTEKQLFAAVGEWEKTFNAVSDTIIIINTAHTILKVNEAFLNIFHVEAKDVVGRKCYEVFHKLDKPWLDCPLEKTRHDQASHVAEIDDPHIGTPLLVTTSPIFDEAGGLTKIVHVGKDISKLKKMESVLQKSKDTLARQNKILVDLTDPALFKPGNTEEVFNMVAESVAKTLEVERVSIWRFNTDGSRLVCRALFELSKKNYSQGLELIMERYPLYHKVLKDERVIAANDVSIDGRVKEFVTSYFIPLGITSMMVVPLRLAECLAGVLCFEHIGPRREWLLEEQNFALSVANVISEMLESEARKKLEEELIHRLTALEQFQRVTVDRELRMKELKEEIGHLKNELERKG
ncbi:MAG: PAS domain S-box protein [Candidatus Omnitrophota bacterium]